MKLSTINPKLFNQLTINLIKVVVILLASRSSVCDRMQAFNRPMVQQAMQRVSPVFTKASPIARTIITGLCIPFSVGYSVRSFEERYDYRGRDGFHDEARHDLVKMSHYAFHTCNMAALIWGIRKLSKPLPEDIRAASAFAGIYFYALGRQFIMDPAESRLMIATKYIPGLCLGIIGINRIPFIKNNLSIIGSVTGIAAAFHLMGFH